MTKDPLFKAARSERADRVGVAAGVESGVCFEVDKQTWKDLDLFDQGRRGVVFSLFNKVKTTGGGDALERMLKDAFEPAGDAGSPAGHHPFLSG